MPTPSSYTEQLGKLVAQDVARQSELWVILRHEPHWLLGAWPFYFALLPGIAVVVGTDLAFPARVFVALGISTAFGLAIEHYRLKKKFKAAVELLEIVDRKCER